MWLIGSSCGLQCFLGPDWLYQYDLSTSVQVKTDKRAKPTLSTVLKFDISLGPPSRNVENKTFGWCAPDNTCLRHVQTQLDKIEE